MMMVCDKVDGELLTTFQVICSGVTSPWTCTSHTTDFGSSSSIVSMGFDTGPSASINFLITKSSRPKARGVEWRSDALLLARVTLHAKEMPHPHLAL